MEAKRPCRRPTFQEKYNEEPGKRRLMRVNVTPAQDAFIHNQMLAGAMSEGEIVRLAITQMMQNEFFRLKSA